MFDIRYRIKTAGPSPDNNKRTELYFAGCAKASSGNPCKNCFNPSLWIKGKSITRDAADFVECLERHAVPKYITIVGGEPTDQIEGLVEFGKLAKAKKYHIILFSWHNIEWLKENLQDARYYFDIIVPGEYREELRIYDEKKEDGLHNVVGSANQFIWLPKEEIAIAAGEISSMSLNRDNVLEVKLYDDKTFYVQQ